MCGGDAYAWVGLQAGKGGGFGVSAQQFVYADAGFGFQAACAGGKGGAGFAVRLGKIGVCRCFQAA